MSNWGCLRKRWRTFLYKAVRCTLHLILDTMVYEDGAFSMYAMLFLRDPLFDFVGASDGSVARN